MDEENVEMVRRAFEAYVGGDVQAILGFIDPDLEWTYLDPSEADPEPRVCHGRHELEVALHKQADRGLMSELEEVIGHGDHVVVVLRTPGIDAHRMRKTDDRDYDVVTVEHGRIAALKACRTLDDALALAGSA